MRISTLAKNNHITDKHWSERSADTVKYIIPHHMAGRLSGEGCANYFVNNGLENSANYCIGYEGDISCNVPEEYGAWTSSFGIADRQAITMEISDTAYGDWTIPKKAQEAFIELCVDLFKRYPSLGGKAVFDPSDAATVSNAKKNGTSFIAKGNILLHKWTSNYGTSCPEWHMIQILPELVKEINRRLEGVTPEPLPKKTLVEVAQDVIDGTYGNDPYRSDALTKAGYDPKSVQEQVDKMLSKKGLGLTIPELTVLLPHCTTGSKGDAVVLIQTWLKKAGYIDQSVAVDGSFGPITQAAVLKFQENINKIYGNMEVDGIWGPKCWSRILNT